MAHVVKEMERDFPPATMEVLQQERNEVIEPWQIISIRIDTITTYTPGEIISLGEWLVEKAQYVLENYNSKGKKVKKDGDNK